jgi:thioredoxin 1
MSGNIIEANDRNFEEVVLRPDKPVLVDFSVPWCGPCRRLAPVVERLSEDYDESIRVVQVNVDGAPMSAQRYGIQGIPSLFYSEPAPNKSESWAWRRRKQSPR